MVITMVTAVNNNPHKTFRFLRWLPGVITVAVLVSCAPVAPIQSARVMKSGVGSVSNYSYTKIDIRATFYDTSTTPRSELSDNSGNYADAISFLVPSLRLSIKDGFEISGLNFKLALFNIGENRLFHNAAMALFAGGNGMFSEWSRFGAVWGGIILGTHAPLLNGDYEIVFMPSITFKSFNADDGWGDRFDSKHETADFSFGIIASPFSGRWLDARTGVVYKYLFHENYSATSVQSIHNEITVKSNSPWCFYFGLGFYFNGNSE
jgi:hypothetical protein